MTSGEFPVPTLLYPDLVPQPAGWGSAHTHSRVISCARGRCDHASLLVGWSAMLVVIFSARQHMLSALYAVCPSVCLSDRPSLGWISRKWFTLGSCNFHYTLAPSLALKIGRAGAYSRNGAKQGLPQRGGGWRQTVSKLGQWGKVFPP